MMSNYSEDCRLFKIKYHFNQKLNGKTGELVKDLGKGYLVLKVGAEEITVTVNMVEEI